MPRLVPLLVLAVLLSGCASSRVPAVLPATLGGINEALDGRWATLVLTDSTRLDVQDIEIGPATTTYEDRRTGAAYELATDRVLEVGLRDHPGARRGGTIGAVLGAAPGFLLMGLGVGLAFEDGDGAAWAPALVLVGGAGALLGAGTGGLVGATAGTVLTSPTRVVVYRAPFSQYLP